MSHRVLSISAAIALTVLAAGVTMAPPAQAQTSIVALVNNRPITSTEVSERRAFVRLTSRKQISAKEALDQLIDQNLIFAEAERRQMRVTDAEVDQRLQGIAQNAKMSMDQLSKVLGQAGTSTRAFRSEIRAGLLKRRFSTALARLSTGISEKDIAAGITARKKEGDGTAYRYQMQQVVFVTKKGASAAQINQRKNEAESFRRRVSSCAQAATVARELRDVAVKPPVGRISSQLPEAFRDQLASMKVGQSTKAEASEQGVEVIFICDKQQTSDDSGLRADVQNQLISEFGSEEADKYVADLRRRALIIYK